MDGANVGPAPADCRRWHSRLPGRTRHNAPVSGEGASGSAEPSAVPRTATLEELADELDGQRFVGRRRELVRIDQLLDAPVGRVILLHGPGGIGKSALLREIARHARRHDRPTYLIDCRDAVPIPASL